MSYSKTQPLSFQDWSRRMRRRMLKDLLRAAGAQARAMAKKSRRPRRGRAATERGLFVQQLAADHRRIFALMRQLAQLAAERSNTDGPASRGRSRAKRRVRSA